MKFNNLSDINLEGSLVQKITYKTQYMPYITIIFSICLLFLNKTYGYIISGIMFVFSLLVIFLVKDFPVMNIYSKGVLIFNPKDNKQATFKEFEEIKEWTITKSKSGCDCILFKFNDESEYFVETFQTSKASSILNKYIKHKESKEIRMANDKKGNVSFGQAFRNIGNSLKDIFKI